MSEPMLNFANELFNSHNNLMMWTFALPLFHRWENRDLEKLSGRLKITQLGNIKIEI